MGSDLRACCSGTGIKMQIFQGIDPKHNQVIQISTTAAISSLGPPRLVVGRSKEAKGATKLAEHAALCHGEKHT